MASRKRMLNTFKEATSLSSYAEMPVLSASVDPQLHLSKNEIRQPFFLICEKDCLLAQLTGRARLELRNSPTSFFDMKMGDHVYIPGGTPHRFVPFESSIVYRYKAAKPGREAISWYCESCGNKLTQFSWDVSAYLPQEGYDYFCRRFNENETLRRCTGCGATHAPIDLSQFHWAEIAAQLRKAEDI